MPKRKRTETEDVLDKIEDRAVRIKASRLQAKIDHGLKSLKVALNLARGFERQKLGRRQKQASSEPHTLLRLREEVIVLKELDIAKTAGDYLFKQCVRTKRIRESAAFTALYGENPKTEPPKSNAEANVLGRLFKANPVTEVLPGILISIKQVLNLDDANSKDGRQQQESNVIKDSREIEHSTRTLPPNDTEEDFGGFSDEATVENVNVLADSDDDLSDEDLQAYNDRIAASSEDENTSDPNGDDNLHELDPMEISDAESIEGDEQSLASTSPNTSPEIAETPLAQAKTPAITEKVSSTAFLPSLSMGGYYSGSESGSDDEYDKTRGPAVPKERKNRRGQRARQQLAELKYGKEAKHLQKQQKNKDDRGSGWDAKRGAVASTGYDPRQKRFGKGGLAKKNVPTGANGEALVGNRSTRKPSATAAKKNEGPLHPSWEAAKKRKQETGKVSFAGKKITFS